MDHVEATLYLGGRDSATDSEALRAEDIGTIVSLTHDTPAVPIESITDVPQHSPSQFQQGVVTIIKALEADEKVLVHCAAGTSRIPTVAGTALAVVEDMQLDDAFRLIEEARLEVDPHESLLRRAGYVYTELSTNR